MRTLILIIFISCLSHTRAELCWQVCDEQGQPVIGATIAATDTLSAKIIEVTRSDKDGKGCLTTEFDDRTVIHVSANGFVPYSGLLTRTAPTIVLNHDVTCLEELTVTATRDHLTQKGGTFVFTPGSLRTEVANVYDLVNYAPLIKNEDGTFKILGRLNPAKIKINGEEARAWGSAAITEALKSLPATMVRRVEVSPDEDMAEKSGLGGGSINIVLAMPDEGILSRVNAGISYKRGFATNDSYWIGWKREKFKGAAAISFSEDSGNYSGRNEYGYLDIGKHIDQISRSRFERQRLKGGISMSYDITRTGTLGASVGIGSDHEWKSEQTTGTVSQDSETRETFFRSQMVQPWYVPAVGIGIWYTDRPNPQKNILDIYAGYSHNAVDSYNIYDDGQTDSHITRTRQDLGKEADSYHVTAKFQQMLNPAHNISGGYQIGGLRSRQEQEYAGAPTDDFRYTELTNALFAEWNAKWSARFSTKVGLRGENLHMSGLQTWNGESFSKNYPHIFPSLSMSLSIPKGDQGISLSVSHSVENPLYVLLNPYIRWTSENSYTTGNPNIKPAYGWESQLLYSFLNNWVVGCDWSHCPNYRNSYTYYRDGYTVTSYTNIDLSDRLSFHVQFYRSFWERLRLNVTAALTHQAQKGMVEGSYLRSTSTTARIDVRLNWLISRTYQWRATADFWYESPERGLTSDYDMLYDLAIGISKEWKCGLRLNARASYLIYPYSGYTYSSSMYTSNYRPLNRPCRLALGLSYAFGNLRVKGAAEREMEIK